MKALSIRQPWAWLITQGYKDIENRTWRTKLRGPFWIHAGKTFDQVGYDEVRATQPHITMPLPAEFQRGGIVGRAVLVDCVDAHNSEWFTGPYGFVLRDAAPVPFRPLRGRLSFFAV